MSNGFNAMNTRYCPDDDTIESPQRKIDPVLVDLETKFNTVIVGMIKHITDYHCDAKMQELRNIIEELIKKNPEEPIACFLLHIYKNDDYRTNILKENDKFFLDQKYEHLTRSDQSIVTQLFEFKELWKKIDQDTKIYIKRAMKGLVLISGKYVLSIEPSDSD